MHQLRWLPERPDWRAHLRAALKSEAELWPDAVALANARLDFVRTNALDEAVRRRYGDAGPAGIGTKPVRLAVL